MKSGVPFLDLKRQIKSIRNEIDVAVARVIDHAGFILGSEVKEFEENLAAYCNVKYAVGCASGSDSLVLALIAAGVKPGDKVITSSYSFFASAGSIVRVGAIPVFVDIDPVSFNLDLDHLKDSITKDVSAIVPVHLFGQMCDMDRIMDLAGEIPVIEDGAQSIGATWNGKPMASISTAACLSFFPSKNLGGFGDGGVVLTNSEEIAETCRIVRVHGAKKAYHHCRMGFNSRLDAIQAAILGVKLKYLDEWNTKRRQNADMYNKAFKESSIVTPRIDKNPSEKQFRRHISQLMCKW